MARVVLLGKWKKKTPIGTLLLLVCTLVPTLSSPTLSSPSPSPTVEVKCPDGDYHSDNGICCNKCSAGFKLKRECLKEGERSDCERCPDEQYTDQINYVSNCRRCKRCKANEEEVSKCERSKNRECRCKDGFFKKFIDSETYDCLKCTPCGPGQRQTQECTHKQDRICECETGYYRNSNYKKECLPCRNCTADCEYCPPALDVKSKQQEEGERSKNTECKRFINSETYDCLKCTPCGPGQQQTQESPKSEFSVLPVVIGVALIVLLVVVAFTTYKATKHRIKKKLRGSIQSSETAVSLDTDNTVQILIHREEPSYNDCNKAIPQRPVFRPVSEQELNNLPDCIPLEIKTSELIYTVLDLVPVPRVKQLARLLGVTDIEIERVETDHRSCKEAHYQMLRVWAERRARAGGRPGHGGVLHQPLLRELLDRLDEMHLGGAAQKLETKYSIH